MSSEPAAVESQALNVLSRAVTPVLSVLGIGVSSYLLWVRLGGSLALCTGVGGCETVNASPYALIGGIPVSLVGVLTYLAILALSLWRGWWGGPWMVSLVIFGMALVGVLFSIYLTYLELYVILAVCPWCVASAVLMVGILADSWRQLEL